MIIEAVGSLQRQARVGRALIFTVICCAFVGLGLYQPNVADAETLSAPVSTVVATSPRNATAAYVVMQRIQVTSAAGGTDDGKVVLNSITVNNPGNANVAAGRVYLSTTATTTIPADAVQIGRTLGVWSAATPTTIVLSSGTTTQRSVFTGTPAYVYIVYDMLSTQATRTTQSNVTAIGVVGPDTANAVNYSSNVITLSAGGAKATVVNCFDCHGDANGWNMDGTRSSATGSFVGSHNKHATSLSLACAVCHSGGALSATNTGHRNNFINMSNPIFSGTGGYSKASGPTYSFPQSSNPTMGTCTTIYCHSNGVATYSNPAWGGAPMNAQCTGCHGGNATTAAPIASNAHTSHMNSLGSVGRLLKCGDCHNATVSPANDQSITGSANHVNGSSNVKFDNVMVLNSDNPTYSGTTTTIATGAVVAPGTYGTCNNIYCHSSGNLFNSSGTGTIVVSGLTPTFKQPDWNVTAVGCTGCHGNGGLKSHPVYTTGAGGSTTANSHVKHVENSNIGCAYCHAGTVGSNTTTTPTSMPSNTWHLNRVEDVTFLANGGATGAYNPAVGNKTCSANYCHGVSNTSPSWGGATTCISCHQATNSGTGLSTRHIQHYNTTTPPTTLSDPDTHSTTSYAYGCKNCHPQATHAQGPAVANLQDAQVGGLRLAPYTAGGTSALDSQGYKYTVAGTCTTNCHTRDGVASSPVVTPYWNGAATGACNICHRAAGDSYTTMTTTATRLTMTHAIHMANDRYAGGQPTNFTCEACHTGTALSNIALQPTGRNQHPNAAKDVAFGSFPTGTWNGTACQNTYCHSNGMAVAGTHGLITWATATATNCGSCHGSAATLATNAHAKHLAASTQNGPITCDDCHNATASSNTLINSYANHVNKNVTINFNVAVSGPTATYNGVTAGGASVYQKLPGTATGTCNATYCHGANSQTWSTVNIGTSTCVTCHGVAGATPAQYSANILLAAPGYISTTPVGTGVNTAGGTGTYINGVSNDPKVGAHDSHLRGTSKFKTNGIGCDDCHAVTALTDSGHMNGITSFAWSNLARNISTTPYFADKGTITPSYNYGTGACSTNYCHGGGFAAAVMGTGVTPTWTSAGYLTSDASVTKNSVDCNRCHLSPPTASVKFDHSTMVLADDCFACHNHNGSGTTHIDGILYGAGTCNSCHDYDVDATTGDWGKSPKAIEGWGAHATHITHLKTLSGATLSAAADTFGGAVYRQVCGVCHTTQTALHSMGGTTNTRSITFSDGSLTYQFATSSGTPTYTGVAGVPSLTTPKTCSNISCHYQTTPVWQGY